jgi:hypothetical protein
MHHHKAMITRAVQEMPPYDHHRPMYPSRMRAFA